MDRLTPGPDGLSMLLGEVNVRSAVYCRSELGAPWGFRVDGSPRPKFHLLLEGRAILILDDETVTQLSSGDLALLPHGDGHVLQDCRTSPIPHLDRILKENPPDLPARMSYGGPARRRRCCAGASSCRPTRTSC